MKLYQNGKFYRLYFLCGSGASSFMLVIYDLYSQWKLLIKIQLYVIQLGIEVFSFLCRVLHTYWIYSSSNYEIWDYRAIIDCHHMPLKLLSDGTLTGNSSLLVLSHTWMCWAIRIQKTHSPWLPDIFTVQSYQALWTWENEASYKGWLTHLNFHLVVKKRGFPSGMHALQGIVRFWFTGYKKKILGFILPLPLLYTLKMFVL